MPKEEDKSSEQKSAEAEVDGFRKDLGPFVVAAETTRMPMVFTDAREPEIPIIFANDSFLSLTGYDREEVLGRSFKFLMERDSDPAALAQIAAAFESGSDTDPQKSLPPQGRQHFLGLHLYQPGAGRERRRRAAFRLVHRSHQA
jgi:PAS domain S-box-containing protein